ncbi:MAG: hypothetical protein ACP5NX_03275 [Candidatus Bilamarchaeaceae archaeon]
MDHLTIASIMIVVLMLAGGYLLLAPPPVEHSVVMIEEPLHKLAPLGLEPGDSFTYVMAFNGTNSTLSYRVVAGGRCMRVLADYTDQTACIFPDGTDSLGSNVTLSQDFVVFRPWMLAARPGWSWTVSVVVPFPFNKEMDRITYRTLGMEDMGGRETLVVGVYNSDGELIAKEWVDEEKRVLVKEESGDLRIYLLS